jgi:hypothetical protein
MAFICDQIKHAHEANGEIGNQYTELPVRTERRAKMSAE